MNKIEVCDWCNHDFDENEGDRIRDEWICDVCRSHKDLVEWHYNMVNSINILCCRNYSVRELKEKSTQLSALESSEWDKMDKIIDEEKKDD